MRATPSAIPPAPPAPDPNEPGTRAGSLAHARCPVVEAGATLRRAYITPPTDGVKPERNDLCQTASRGIRVVHETATDLPRLSERVKGIEPSLSAWEADVLPLNYTRGRT